MPPVAQAEAGPSRPRSNGKVVNYDSSDAGDSDPPSPSPSPRRVKTASLVKRRIPPAGVDAGSSTATPNDSPSKLINGVAGSSAVNGTPRKRRRVGRQDTAEDGERRRMEAEKLFVTRKELPFYQGRKMILEEVVGYDTTIILGETGCGKSTQLPQLLRRHHLALQHYSRPPRIAITQPRRLPAIALANRVAAEMGVQLGAEVGYSVRFEDMTSRDTGIRYLTEGVLMRELANPPREPGGADESGLNLLLHYDVIVIDEAHERTLNTDFLCGALKKVQRIRKRLSRGNKASEGVLNGASNGSISRTHFEGEVGELKIIVMSATLDPSKFVRFFETGRPALIVKGRMYSVATQHLLEPVTDYIESAAKQVMGIHSTQGAEGDILVFMPGAEEIETCAEICRRAMKELPETSLKLTILPLYSQLPPGAQAKIFARPAERTRRVVIATNIAETSLTIPGVSFVVDTGYKKEKEYIYRTSGAIEHLRLKPISQAAAWQRTGRAGRERAGECFRLYTRDGFQKLANFDSPEIQRCNLASAVLQLVAMGQSPFEFEYIDDPGREAFMAAFQTLAGLEALAGPTEVTPIGRRMLRYPLDPSHARILLSSFQHECASEIIDVLSLVVNGPVWVDRASERDAAAAARSKFLSREGDHLTAMNVFRAYMAIKDDNKARSGSQQSVAAWARENHVNTKTLQAALKVRTQLRELVQRDGEDPAKSCGMEVDKVQRCLLSGLFMSTAVIQSDGTYRQTAGSLVVKIHPSSVLMSKKVPAILYDELTITTAMYARNVSAFDQSWLAEIPWFRHAGGKLAPRSNGTS